ncbi:MAG: CpsD/CapB family tyrosine-protein kinase [Clostridium sp.]|nr:CpsD/CapB family tyrosine-protein kinase [Clostridium sp.]MCI7441759.1 CpsD/CapB family tyrosine-protein kinase [Clostridium sp.]
MPSILDDPKSYYAEAFRTIKTNIKYSSADKHKKVILVTSTEAGEGKSTISSNLALSLSQDNKKIVIVDGDLRKPSIHKQFRISGSVGLTEVLIGEQSLSSVKYKINPYLDAITSGHIPPNPAELLASEEMEKLIKNLKEEYDYVIIDTNPIGLVADAQILSSKVDGVILVARYEKTKKENLLNCKKMIDQVGGNTIGVVLNGIDEKKGKYYYYY